MEESLVQVQFCIFYFIFTEDSMEIFVHCFVEKVHFLTQASRSDTVKPGSILVLADGRRHSMNCSAGCAHTSLCCSDICKDPWLGNSSPGLTSEERQFHNS